jgi:hypothetical protein
MHARRWRSLSWHSVPARANTKPQLPSTVIYENALPQQVHLPALQEEFTNMKKPFWMFIVMALGFAAIMGVAACKGQCGL